MQDALADLLKRRRDRAIAIILSIKERECDSYLPRETRIKLRKVVLDQLNEFYDVAVDIMLSLDPEETVHFNEVWLDKIDEIHRHIVSNGSR